MIQRKISSLLQNSNSSQFLGGTGAAFLIIILGKGVFYVVQLVLARVLGVEGYGVYIYVLTIISILSIFSAMGFDSCLLKYLAMYSSRQQWSLFSGMLRRSIQIPLSLSIFISLMVFIVARSIGSITANHELYNTLVVGCIALPVFTLLKILSSVFRSQKQIVLALFPSEVAVPFLLVAGVSCLSLFGVFQLDSMNILAFHAIVATCALVLFSLICMRKLSGVLVRTSSSLFQTKEWVQTAGTMLLVSGTHIVMGQSDIMLLGVFRGTTEAGIYAIAVKIAVLVSFGLQVGNQIVAPMIAEYYHVGDEKKMQEVVSLGTLISTVFAVFVVLVIVFFADPLLHMFGNEFAVAKVPLFILAVGQLANALMGPVGFLMTMTNHHRQASIIFSVSAVVNILLNCILIPRYGLIGAAVATTFTMLGWNIAFWLYIRKNIGINTLMISFFTRSANG